MVAPAGSTDGVSSPHVEPGQELDWPRRRWKKEELADRASQKKGPACRNTRLELGEDGCRFIEQRLVLVLSLLVISIAVVGGRMIETVASQSQTDGSAAPTFWFEG